eukprot:scaffold12772_cov72-Skeletonema_dohrnii-CCMP3373.AAC.1
MAARTCWHINRCTPPPTSTESNDPSSQTEKMRVAYQAHSSSNPIRACVWMATGSYWHFNRCTPPPTSTESNDLSLQTEKMRVETEFGSHKALVVVAYQAHCSSNPYTSLRVDGNK